ncbi:MAG: hypothetical protein AAFQ74_15900 [Cyanobacteria bacterium J06623_4]
MPIYELSTDLSIYCHTDTFFAMGSTAKGERLGSEISLKKMFYRLQSVEFWMLWVFSVGDSQADKGGSRFKGSGDQQDYFLVFSDIFEMLAVASVVTPVKMADSYVISKE